MLLVPKNKTKKLAKKSKKMYINTLQPHFEFKNKKGKVIKPLNCCITL